MKAPLFRVTLAALVVHLALVLGAPTRPDGTESRHPSTIQPPVKNTIETPSNATLELVVLERKSLSTTTAENTVQNQKEKTKEKKKENDGKNPPQNPQKSQKPQKQVNPMKVLITQKPPRSKPTTSSAPAPTPAPQAPPAPPPAKVIKEDGLLSILRQGPHYATIDQITTLYCVVTNPSVGLQVRLFPNIHRCNIEKYVHLYSFVSFNHRVKGLADKPWSYCERHDSKTGFVNAIIKRQETCAEGEWVMKARGYENDQSLTLDSFVTHSGDHTLMVMNPDQPFSTGYFTELSFLQHLAILRVPKSQDLDYVENLIAKGDPEVYKKDMSYLYQPGPEIKLRAQVTINSLGQEMLPENKETKHGPTRRDALANPMSVGGTMVRQEFEKAGWPFKDEFQIHLSGTRYEDGNIQRIYDFRQFYEPKSYVILCQFLIQEGVALSVKQLQVVVTEALREETMIRVGLAPSGDLIMVTIPRTIPRPSIYTLPT